MFCRFCGEPISSEDKFCSNCGKAIYSEISNKKQGLKNYSDEMSFSSDDLKKVQALLKDSEHSSEKLEKNRASNYERTVFQKNATHNDSLDPDLTLFMPREEITDNKTNFSFKRLFIRLMIIGIVLGVTLGMILNFGLDIL